MSSNKFFLKSHVLRSSPQHYKEDIMRRLYWFLFVLVLAMSVSMGQVYKYVYQGPFPDTSAFKLPFGVINNGVTVDPAGKVWIQAYDISSRDSIDIGGGVYRKLKPIYVFNKNGTQASFSPISKFTGVNESSVTVTDTIYGVANTQPLGYGVAMDPSSSGSIIAGWGLGRIWKINYLTGAGIRRTQPAAGLGANSPAGIAVNQDGEVYLAGVLSGIPGQILNPDFTAGVQFSSAVPAIGRATAVSRDGNDVYAARFTGPNKTYVFHSANGSLGPYALTDSIFHGMSSEAIAVHPTTGYVWASADRRSSKDSISTVKRKWTPNTYYAYNPTTKAIVDSFNVAAWDPGSTGPLPRGIAFSPTGDTVYVAHFDVPTVPAVARFVRVLTSVERLDEPTVPSGYVLEQNFPNPFNPETEIHFKIAETGATTLRVYDVLGREVISLVDEVLSPGSYKARFNAAHLTSGTYVYVLTSGEVRISKKMMLLK
jgi:sugar lactone lactonase YvrE